MNNKYFVCERCGKTTRIEDWMGNLKAEHVNFSMTPEWTSNINVSRISFNYDVCVDCARIIYEVLKETLDGFEHKEEEK